MIVAQHVNINTMTIKALHVYINTITTTHCVNFKIRTIVVYCVIINIMNDNDSICKYLIKHLLKMILTPHMSNL